MDWRNRNDVWFGALHWQAGRNSVVRQIRAEARPGRWEDTARHIFRIDGGGGGRWFAWIEHMSIESGAVDDYNEAFRKLVVSGTSEPLSIYGFNIEHGGSADKVVNAPFVEIDDASNVRTFGTKAETNGVLISVSNSDNIFLSVIWSNPTSPGHDLIHVENSTNIEMDIISWGNGNDSDRVVNEIGFGAAEFVSRTSLLGAFSRGILNWQAWPTSFGEDSFHDPDPDPDFPSIVITSPAIDGEIDDVWNLVPDIDISHWVIGGESDSSLTAKWKTLADDDNLYLLIQVHDDSLVRDSADKSWLDDGVEIYLDANADGETTYGADDFRFFVLSDGTFGESEHGAVLPDASVSVAMTTLGYIVEMAIPWSLVGQSTPIADSLIGIDIAVNDDDDGDKRDGRKIWFNPEDTSNLDTSTLATVSFD